MKYLWEVAINSDVKVNGTVPADTPPEKIKRWLKAGIIKPAPKPVAKAKK